MTHRQSSIQFCRRCRSFTLPVFSSHSELSSSSLAFTPLQLFLFFSAGKSNYLFRQLLFLCKTGQWSAFFLPDCFCVCLMDSMCLFAYVLFQCKAKFTIDLSITIANRGKICGSTMSAKCLSFRMFVCSVVSLLNRSRRELPSIKCQLTLTSSFLFFLLSSQFPSHSLRSP